jgi:hypothetical protein
VRMSHGMCPDCHSKLVGDGAGGSVSDPARG